MWFFKTNMFEQNENEMDHFELVEWHSTESVAALDVIYSIYSMMTIDSWMSLFPLVVQYLKPAALVCPSRQMLGSQQENQNEFLSEEMQILVASRAFNDERVREIIRKWAKIRLENYTNYY